MGYISDVAIVLYKEDYEELISLAKEKIDYFGTGRCILDNPVKHFKYNDTEYTLLRWEYVKWYYEFDEVELVRRFLANHEHSFVRIGEDVGDIEWEVNGDYDFYIFINVHRCIEIDPVVYGIFPAGKNKSYEEQSCW